MKHVPTGSAVKRLNIGCGNQTHSQWVNLDLVATRPEVVRCDIRRGLPFPAESVDVVYHSHVLEHLSKDNGRQFVQECHRVLRPQGVIRVVAPDLEEIAREYLRAFDGAASNPSERSWADLEWMRLELVDQIARTKSGGEMGRVVARDHLPNRDFVRQRIGAELLGSGTARKNSKTFAGRVVSELGRLRRSLAASLCYLSAGRRGYDAFQEGWFRQSGEVHRWMYDRLSLCRLLTEVGFANPTVMTCHTSQIKGFAQFELDEVAGEPRKPDSFYVEAIKPTHSVRQLAA